MEPTLSSETSAFILRTPGKFPKEHRLHSEHDESLKTTIQLRHCLRQYCSLCFCSNFLREIRPLTSDLVQYRDVPRLLCSVNLVHPAIFLNTTHVYTATCYPKTDITIAATPTNSNEFTRIMAQRIFLHSTSILSLLNPLKFSHRASSV